MFSICQNPTTGDNDQNQSNQQKIKIYNSKLALDASSINKEKDKLSIMMRQNTLYSEYMAKNNNNLFQDPDFPPIYRSLQFRFPNRQIIWKRISEIMPQFSVFSCQIQDTEVQKSNIQDRYFLPTLASISKRPNRINTIFLTSKNVSKKCIYKLLLKVNGILKQVIIDDYIPIFSDSLKPVFCKAYGQQIWVILLHKAWAKLKGSYNSSLIGCPHQVLSALCIGPCKTYYIQNKNQYPPYQDSKELWNILKNAFDRKYILLATSINNSSSGIVQSRIFQICTIHQYKQKKIISLSSIWESSYQNQKSAILSQGLNSKQMNFNEFLNNFNRIDISYQNGSFNYQYRTYQIKSSEPLFILFKVNQSHEAFLSIHIPFLSTNYNKKQLRIILGNYNNQQQLFLQQASKQIYFNDCSIHIQNFTIGRHVLLIYADFAPTNQESLITLTYNYQEISEKTKITQFQVQESFYYFFLNSIFKNYASPKSTIFAQENNDIISRLNLLKSCGYACIICKLPLQVKFKLIVSIDQKQISKYGLKLIKKWEKTQQINPGNNIIFIFDIQSHQDQIQFPPKGFSVKKCI